MVLFPSNLLLQTVWKVVKPFLDVTVVQKVVMFSPREYQAGLLSLVDKEHLLSEHGGSCAKRLAVDFAVEIPVANGGPTPVDGASAESEGDEVGTATIVADSEGPDEKLTPVAAEAEVDDVGITTIVADSEWQGDEITSVDAADCNVKKERPSQESAGSPTDHCSLSDPDSDVCLLSAVSDTTGAAAVAPESKAKTPAANALFAHIATAPAAPPELKPKSAAVEALSAVRDAAAAVGSGPKGKTTNKFRFWRKKSTVE
ncbi:MAG: hypothetical protein BJ554DRAFT_8038 [Olpidium bornovanus]|uniref:CRAL-TRIO domain-containing protein n=1 Tax=Olpidium bornovanus TaxID=278681 RepID=A0A8H7ZVL4_9FUNG|nr:MAG: hypothetical protein BJ554DRAFT_8038 [Olpidium bornovanus]